MSVRETPLDVATGAEPEEAYLARRVPAYPAIQRLNRLAGPDDRVVVAIDPFANYYSQAELVPDYAVCLARAGLYGPGRRSRLAGPRQDGHGLRPRRASASPTPGALDWLAPELRRIALRTVYSDGRVRLLTGPHAFR